MFGNRFSSSTRCSRSLHETELGRSSQPLSCCFLKVATQPNRGEFREVRVARASRVCYVTPFAGGLSRFNINTALSLPERIQSKRR